MSDEMILRKETLILHDTAELGKTIHAEALKREQEARQDEVIAEVQRLESARLEYAKRADFAARASEWYARKLEAVRNGDFDFDLQNGQMLFRDPEFQKANY